MKKPTYLELLRRGKGLSIANLARETGMSGGLIAQVEGRHRKAYPKLRKALVKFLGVEEETIFDAEGFAKTLRRR